MKRWLSLLLVLLLGGFLYLNLRELLPVAEKQRAAFRELVARGAPRMARVLSTREERIETTDGAFIVVWVSLEYEDGGRKLRTELRYDRSPIKSPGRQVPRPGDSVEIRVLPDHPERAYAPSYLEFDERMAAPEVSFWMYLALGAAGFAMIALLFWMTVVRS